MAGIKCYEYRELNNYIFIIVSFFGSFCLILSLYFFLVHDHILVEMMLISHQLTLWPGVEILQVEQTILHNVKVHVHVFCHQAWNLCF